MELGKKLNKYKYCTQLYVQNITMPITRKNGIGLKRPKLEKEGKRTYMTLP